MRRFRFSLDTLLSLRREQEQECEIALAQAVGRLVGIEKQMEEARKKGEEVFLAGGSTLEALRSRERLWQKTRADIRKLEQPRMEAGEKVAEQRGIYNQAHARKMALENLREKRRKEWRLKMKREEINRLDEAAKGAAVRKNLQGGVE